MQQLSFPQYTFRIKKQDDKKFIFDIIRKKFVALTPEEWVRQHVVHFLISEKKYPLSLIGVEMAVNVSGHSLRCDVVVLSKKSTPYMVVECKSPNMKITQAVFDQIAVYNRVLESKYLLVTNGTTHFICQPDYCCNTYRFLRHIPNYE